MLNNEPHTADNGYYCVHTARVDIPVSSLQRFNFRNTRSAGSPRSPSSYLESCFVMEMSDEADELDQLFLKQPAAQHPGEEWRVGSVIHP